MTAHAKVSGAWQQMQNIYARVSGNWQTVQSGHVRVGGSWQQFYVAFGGETVTRNGSDYSTPVYVPAGARHLQIIAYGGGGYGQGSYDEDGVYYPGTGGDGGGRAIIDDITLTAADEGYELTYQVGDGAFLPTRVIFTLPSGPSVNLWGNGGSGSDSYTPGGPGEVPPKVEGGTGGSGGDGVDGKGGNGGSGGDGFFGQGGQPGGSGWIDLVFSP